MDRRRAAVRLASLVVGLGCFAAVFAVGGVVGTDAVRARVEPLGAWGPLLYVPLAAVLGTVLVPGAVLAAASGLLFGPAVGLASSIGAATLGALLSREISARMGSAPFEAVASERLRVVARLARHHAVLAVVVARLMPVLPDGPVNHAFGVVGLRARHLAIGTLVASGPRALSYALLGANADDLTGTGALIGIALNVGTGLLGVALGGWLVLRARRERAADLARHAARA